MKKKIVILLIICFLYYKIGLSFSDENSLESKSPYRIGPENVLLIDVYYGKDRNLERKVKVSPDGTINFPLLGNVNVTGLTVSEIENKLEYFLEKDYLVNPQVSVFIEEYSTVSILGQVEEPGAYSIKGNLTVVELISRAGGFTRLADRNNVKVLRKNEYGQQVTIKVRVDDIINKGKEEDDFELEPGDIITVPESFF